MSDFSVCPYCGKPAGKSEIGMVLAIHPHHQAGTPYWARWYRDQRDRGLRKTEVGDALLSMCEERAKSANAGLARMHELQRRKKGET